MSRPSQPWYARLLRIKNLRLTTGWCVLLFEGAIVMAILLALTELVSWWVVPILPLLVAGLVKLNDVIAGAGMKLMRDRDGACPDRPFKA
ncbi:hypothetical protein, partial [Haloglycomyces albus]|uniref:hypothetical protein n=1 Tax=Haloglycomyces albus TaxID=526067 RepID=UPI0004A4391C